MELMCLNSTAFNMLSLFKVNQSVIEYLDRIKTKTVVEQKYNAFITSTTPAVDVIEILLSCHYHMAAVRVAHILFKGTMSVSDVVSLLAVGANRR